MCAQLGSVLSQLFSRLTTRLSVRVGFSTVSATDQPQGSQFCLHVCVVFLLQLKKVVFLLQLKKERKFKSLYLKVDEG